MREIKFRAWDEGNKVMHNDVEFIRSGTEGNDWIVFKSDKQRLEDGKVFDNPYFSQQIKLMQYTGLRDKNGREIYKDDVIEDDCGGRYQIKYSNGGYYAEGINRNYTLKDGTIPVSPWLNVIASSLPHEYTVIGNIFENPELVEGGE